MRTVAEGYGLEISRGGMALCPFHNERTPLQKFIPMLFIASAAERTLTLSASRRKCSG